MDNEIMNQDNNKILIYTSDDGQVKIEVRLEDENVWMFGLLKMLWQNFLIQQNKI